ncbi:MAG: hypothetical protein KGZ97_06510 [Bacteroidetes bacterium]|nr:hypothetical protein [Bacteroidota bacterium]
MKRFHVALVILISLFFAFSCEKDPINPPDDTDLAEEKLFLTVWEYDIFSGQNVKSGAFLEYYVRGETGSALIYGQAESDETEPLYEYQIIPKDNSHHVYFSENGASQNEKKFEYSLLGNNLMEIRGFHNGSLISNYIFAYDNNTLNSILKDGVIIATGIQYDSRGNITRISRNNGSVVLYYHFKICETKNPYRRIFRNFNIYTESLFSIISCLNPNFVLDAVCSTYPEFDWNTYSIKYSAEANTDNYPHIIRERRYDTQGNMVLNKIIAEYEYHLD